MNQLSINQKINRKINLKKKRNISLQYQFWLKTKQDIAKNMWFGESKLVNATKAIGIYDHIQKYVKQ